MLSSILAFELVWFGALAVYLASTHQVLLSKPLDKKYAAAFFVFTNAVALWLLADHYLLLSALFLNIVHIMLVWVCLALIAPYWRKLNGVLIAGSSVAFVFALMGG